MKLTHITIHNFRGIHDATVNLFDYNLLVGPNNAGKSTVIDAIRVFYEKDGFKFKQDRDFPFVPGKDEDSWVELTFALADEEDASLKEDYRQPDKTLRVRKFLKSADKNQTGSIFGYRIDGTISDEPFYGAKNVQSGKFGDIVYIPAVSKVDDHMKLSGPSALRDLLTNVLESVVESSPSYTRFATDFETFAKDVKTETTTEGHSLSGVESELNGLIGAWGANFRLDMRSPSTADIIKSLLSYECTDQTHGKPLPVEQFGSGFQRHFIFSLIQLGAKYISKKASKKAKDFTPDMKLLLFEEPEAFLHPPQQEILSHSLRTLAEQPTQQILCSTHSSHFVSKQAADIPSLTRLKRDGGCISAFQLDQPSWDAMTDANQLITDIATKWPKLKKKLEDDDTKPEMEAIKYFLWLNPDRCGLFFANHVLIVEGPTEQAFINKLMGDGKIPVPRDGIYILDSLGKFNMHRFMNLLARLGIPHSVMFDDDKEREEHEDINQLIHDSQHAGLTTNIASIDGDIETLLKAPKQTQKHRKPQHLLFCYASGQIDESCLDKFIDIVATCLPESTSTAPVECSDTTEEVDARRAEQ